MNWESLKGKAGAALAAVLGFLFLLFKYEQKRANDSEAKLANAEVDKKEAVLEEKHNEVERQIADEHKKADEEKSKKLSQEETEKFLKGL